MKKYKILIVHNYYKVPGGEDTVVENEKELLKDNGHEVIMYTRSNNEIENRRPTKILKLIFETIFSIKTYKEVKKIIKVENIDIVHVHNTLPLVSPSVYYAAFHCKVPVIQTIHNFRLLCPAATFTINNKVCERCVKRSLLQSVKYKCYRDSRIQSFISAVNLIIHRKLGTYRRVNSYIALTEFNREKISALIDKEKIVVKPNFIKQIKYDIKEKEDYFIYVGRLDILKGINLLIKAWQNIDKKLVIVGDGPYKIELLKFIESNNNNNIEFVGYKNKAEVMKLIAASKAMVVPSQWYEGFPMTIVESFSLGIPVIAGDIGNLGVIVEHGYNGLLFKYDDASDLFDKVNELIRDELRLEILGKGALETYQLKYNEIKNYELLNEIYTNSLGGIDET